MITQTYDLNLVPGGVPVRVPCSQYDDGSRTVVFNLFNGSEKFTNIGVTGRIDGTRADGAAFQTAATISNGAATWTISLDMTAAAGEHKAELIIIDTGGNVLGTKNFIISVEARAKDPNADPTEEEINLWQQYYDQTAALVGTASTKASEAASSASDASGYADDAADSAAAAAASAASIVFPTVDMAIDDTSTNAVQNKVIAAALAKKLSFTDIDTEMDAESDKPVANAAVCAAMQPVVLWTNDLAEFAAQTISVPELSDYKVFIIGTQPFSTVANVSFSVAYVPSDMTVNIYAADTVTGGTIRYFTFDLTSETIAISLAHYVGYSGSSTRYGIPIIIIGLR